MPELTEPEKPKFIPGREFKEPPPEYADIAGSNAEIREELSREAEEQRAKDIARKAERESAYYLYNTSSVTKINIETTHPQYHRP